MKGKYIKVVTSYTDGRGNLETTTTLTSETVANTTISLSSVKDQDLTMNIAIGNLVHPYHQHQIKYLLMLKFVLLRPHLANKHAL
jgi:hypothetical protein